MTIYRLEKDNGQGTLIEIQSNNKQLFNRLEIAIDHILKEYDEND